LAKARGKRPEAAGKTRLPRMLLGAARALQQWRAYPYLRHPFDAKSRHGLRVLQHVPPEAFQPFATTAFNRHPKLFAWLAAALRRNPAPRILSFGCSTGEEVLTLRAHFRGATIRGLDVHPLNIQVCERRLRAAPDAGLSYRLAGHADDEPAEHYDLILAMSVFRHGGLETTRLPRCDALIRFADVERVLGGLARCLRPGGLLVLTRSNFHLADTRFGHQFEPLLTSEEAGVMEISPVYDRDNAVLSDTPAQIAVWRFRPDGFA